MNFISFDSRQSVTLFIYGTELLKFGIFSEIIAIFMLFIGNHSENIFKMFEEEEEKLRF